MRTYLLKNPYKIKEVVAKLNLIDTGEAWGSDTKQRIVKNGEVPSRFLIAKEEAQVIGWCARFKDKQTHLFIHKKKRRKGYGSRLLQRMAKESGLCKVIPWDAQARQFFNCHLGKKIKDLYA